MIHSCYAHNRSLLIHGNALAGVPSETRTMRPSWGLEILVRLCGEACASGHSRGPGAAGAFADKNRSANRTKKERETRFWVAITALTGATAVRFRVFVASSRPKGKIPELLPSVFVRRRVRGVALPGPNR